MDFKSDLNKYQKYSRKHWLILLLTQQGLWAIFVFRVSNSIYKSKIPIILKKPLLFLCVIWQKVIEILTGISLPYSASIGKGFYIGHFGGVIINSDAKIGEGCNLSQGVTIGVSGHGNKRGVPELGNKVYVGVNSVIVGKIKVGDNAVIGANSLVNKNVMANTTVLGVPAVKINDNDSRNYI